MPPLVEASWTPAPTWSRTQGYAEAGRAEPVQPMTRIADRSCTAGSTPSFAMASRYWGLVPKTVTLCRAASSHRTSGRVTGAGLPS